MAELLLPEDAENHTYSHLRSSVSTNPNNNNDSELDAASTPSTIINNTHQFSTNSHPEQQHAYVVEDPKMSSIKEEYRNETSSTLGHSHPFDETNLLQHHVQRPQHAAMPSMQNLQQLIAPTPIYPTQSTNTHSTTTTAPMMLHNKEDQFIRKNGV